MNLNLTDGNTHRVSLYLLDWSNMSRSETITIRDAATQTVLDSETFSNFNGGQYASWNVKGNVIIEADPVAGSTPLICGIFLGPGGTASTPPPPTGGTSKATFSGFDASTQGSWTGVYGGDGFLIPNDTKSSVPSYATVSQTGASIFEWTGTTSDVRALQDSPGSTNRFASTYYASGSFNINLNLNDGNAHRVAVYFLDWDASRTETIKILDATTQAVLDTEIISNFHNGEYAVWNLQGNVIIPVDTIGVGPSYSVPSSSGLREQVRHLRRVPSLRQLLTGWTRQRKAVGQECTGVTDS